LIGTRRRHQQHVRSQEVRIDFSFKREVFFIVAGAIVGAVAMAFPLTFLSVGSGLGYSLTWIVFGHIAGIHYPIESVIAAGFLIHLLTATCIGLIAGLFLYKTNILNISKPSNGLLYGLLVGFVVYLIFAIPVEQFVLSREFEHVVEQSSSAGTFYPNKNNYALPKYKEDEYRAHQNNNNNNNLPLYGLQIRSTVTTIMIHLLFGTILGLFSSILSIKFGSRYRCPHGCDISFSRIDTLQIHLKSIHGDNPIQNRKKILILGGGFGGVTVLNKLQDRFQTDVSVDIAIVSKDNYLLFTPMLHEIASGTIETRHIITPIRTFCNRSRFYCAVVESVDLDNKKVQITSSLAPLLHDVQHSIGSIERNSNYLYYDYLVIAVGSETRFFGMSDVQQNALTIKSLDDALRLRNHIISILEQADQLLPESDYNNKHIELQKNLLTFVVVGGGFAGVETAGELNDFVRDSINDFYHNIDSKNVKFVIVQSGNRLLPEMSEELGQFALKNLRKKGIEIILNNRVIGATKDNAKLKDGKIIPTKTIIWSGGVAPESLVSNLVCTHDDKSGRIIVDKYLEIPKYRGVFSLGDCALIIDPHTGNPYPPTAQHAVREGETAAKNIIAEIEEKPNMKEVFDYKTRGMMASIGKRTGVGNLLGIQVHGFLAWWIWRNYYLANLPTFQKKIRVLADWIVDIFFKRDVTMLKTFAEQRKHQ
jgi:NADH:ubiquinone reductase (H+-translocating)